MQDDDDDYDDIPSFLKKVRDGFKGRKRLSIKMDYYASNLEINIFLFMKKSNNRCF
jgi:hypothetical protein